jgi:hypothetical protein
MSFLPQNNREDPPRETCTDPIDRQDSALDTVVPAQSNQPYDIKNVILKVIDSGDFFEVQEHLRGTLSSALRGWTDAPLVSSPISRRISPAASISTLR